MEWIKEVPEEDGYYLIKYYGSDDQHTVYLDNDEGEMIVWPIPYKNPVSINDIEWWSNEQVPCSENK